MWRMKVVVVQQVGGKLCDDADRWVARTLRLYLSSDIERRGRLLAGHSPVYPYPCAQISATARNGPL